MGEADVAASERFRDAPGSGSVPGSHLLTVLPFFSGERTPYWRGDLRAAITGLSFSTDAFDVLRASLEAVALGFAEIYKLLSAAVSPNEIIASGGGLLRSPGWTQMMADALSRPITACTETETSCRGAALWAMERAGILRSMNDVSTSMGIVYEPRAQYRENYARLRDAQRDLYERLFEPR